MIQNNSSSRGVSRSFDNIRWVVVAVGGLAIVGQVWAAPPEKAPATQPAHKPVSEGLMHSVTAPEKLLAVHHENQPAADAKLEAGPKLPSMSEELAKTAHLPAEKMVKMELHAVQEHPAVPVEGKLQGKFNPAVAHQAVAGQGPQMGSPSEKRLMELKATGKTHLRLIMKVTRDGKAEVISSSEEPGEAIIPDVVAGSFVYQVKNGADSLITHAIPDPFEHRAYPGPPGSPAVGHHVHYNDTAEVIVKVPNTKIAAANLDKLQVQLFKIKPGETITHIDPAILAKLDNEKRLELKAEVKGQILKEQIQAKQIKVVP